MQGKYTLEFKQTIVNLYRSGQNLFSDSKEVWRLVQRVKQRGEAVFRSQNRQRYGATAQQIKMLQKRNAQLEEEKLIQKNIAIFAPHSDIG